MLVRFFILCACYTNFCYMNSKEPAPSHSLRAIKPRINHKPKMHLGQSKDRISTLPSAIIEKILMLLPLREAVQTSILSRDWRFKWCYIPELTFDERSFQLPFNYSEHESQIQSSIVRSVDQVLLLHLGPIYSFELINILESCSDINRWILVLSRSGIRRLILHLKLKDLYPVPSHLHSFYYTVPSHLFSCDMITSLDLFNCSFIPPDSFKGFNNLKTLILVSGYAPADKVEILIANSPHLEDLILVDVLDGTSLAVRAPKLRSLTIASAVLNLCLESTPLVDFACIEISDFSRNFIEGYMAGFNLMKVLSSIPNAQKLRLQLYTLRVSQIPRQLPFTFMLKKLNMDINLRDGKEVFAALAIIRSCPLLEKLHVSSRCEGHPRTYVDFWEELDDLTKLLNSLRKAKLTNVRGTYHEMKFIEFLLANAPFLKIFKIKSEEEDQVIQIAEHLSRFQRCSPQQQVLFETRQGVSDLYSLAEKW